MNNIAGFVYSYDDITYGNDVFFNIIGMKYDEY
jgi:hypothetical protein